MKSDLQTYIRRDSDGIEVDVTSGVEYLLNRRGLLIEWSCTCGRSWTMETPGFPGSRIWGRHSHAGSDPSDYNAPCPGEMTGRLLA